MTGTGWRLGPSSRSCQPNILAFSEASSSPGSRPRATPRAPRFLPIRLGGIGAGMSSFKFIAIAGGVNVAALVVIVVGGSVVAWRSDDT